MAFVSVIIKETCDSLGETFMAGKLIGTRVSEGGQHKEV